MSEEYVSEFQTPDYSVFSQRREGTKIITTVFIDGDLVVFEVEASTAVTGAQLESPRIGIEGFDE